MSKQHRSKVKMAYVVDTNVLIHDPRAIHHFEEHQVIIPMPVLEELDRLKDSHRSIAADCRTAIRKIDQILGDEPPNVVQSGVALANEHGAYVGGTLRILMNRTGQPPEVVLPNDTTDNRIINSIAQLQLEEADKQFVLVSKDINMRLKARGCNIEAEDYQTDQVVSDVEHVDQGYVEFRGSFWDSVDSVHTEHNTDGTYHFLPKANMNEVFINQFLLDESDFCGFVQDIDDETVKVKHLPKDQLMHQTAWGLSPRDIYQAIALNALLDPDVHLVNLLGPAGSGKTILALASAIEMIIERKMYNKIIVTRSTPPLAEDQGFLPGTEEEKMDPWLGAVWDNIEALHIADENPKGSMEFVKEKANIQFKALNYIRGRSFQKALILIDEAQNLTPHQMKAIITRAGEGSKVVCLGNLAQIDTAYLTPISSGLTYLTERFKGFGHSVSVALKGIPRSILAEYAERHL